MQQMGRLKRINWVTITQIGTQKSSAEILGGP